MSFTYGQVLYRLVDSSEGLGGLDLDGEWVFSGHHGVRVRWEEWVVEKVTPKGAWIVWGSLTANLRPMNGRRWVSNHNRFVHPTKVEAKAAAVFRRSYHIKKSKQRMALLERRLVALENVEV